MPYEIAPWGLLNWFIQKHFIIKELNLFEIKFVDKIRLQNAKMANVVIDECINVHSRLWCHWLILERIRN